MLSLGRVICVAILLSVSCGSDSSTEFDTIASISNPPQAVSIQCHSTHDAVNFNVAADGDNLTWEFDRDPEVSKMLLRTRPSGTKVDDHRNFHNGGYGLLWYQQLEIPIRKGLSYQVELPRQEGPQAIVDVDLVTTHSDGSECESRIFSNFIYPSLTSGQRELQVPQGVSVDLKRYSDLEVPAPTVEALVHAFSAYHGRSINGDEEPEYSRWSVEANKTIRDYSPKLRYFLFGSETEIGNWWAVAQMLEIIAVLAPHLDARFATSVDEVTFPEFSPLCEPWMIAGVKPYEGQTEFQQPCQRRGNGAYFGDGTARPEGGNADYVNSRGFTYHNKFVLEQSDLDRSDLNWIRDKVVGQEVNNPCCTINFHETGHAFGVDHTACGYSALSFWEERNTSYMTKTWNEDDLAGMAIHLDPRTTHGMTIGEAADALGIPQDDRYQELLEKPWRACGNQDPGWDLFAERLHELHISSPGVETNHPQSRSKIKWTY